MPRKKGRQPKSPSLWLNNKRKLMIGVGLLISLLASGILAQKAHLWHALKPTASPMPTGLAANSPSKEYIYAGSRLVATEEPASQGGGCTYGLSSTSQNFLASGGTSSVNVTAGTGCAWTATSNAAWVTITSGSSGNGNGTVNYSVTVNTGAARNTTMTIAQQTFTVTQNAAGCTYSIWPTSQNFIASGGTNSVAVTAGTGCTWTATSNAAWITITSGSSGSGNGTVNYSVAANPGGARNSTITIAQQTFTVTQDAAAACSYSIAPTSAALGAGGGSSSFNITAGSGCGWTATSSVGWITITSGSPGSGNGPVGYTVAANTGAARSGSITIDQQTFTVTQSAAGGPPAPTNLTATVLTSTSIRLNWSFVEDGISIFKIERKTGTTGTYAQITFANNGDRTYPNTKLAAHTTYCYRIRAYNGQDGAYSNEACATTP